LGNANNDGSKERTFKELTNLGVDHCNGQCKEKHRVNLEEIVKINFFLPSFVGERENENLMEDVIEGVLKPARVSLLNIRVLV